MAIKTILKELGLYGVDPNTVKMTQNLKKGVDEVRLRAAEIEAIWTPEFQTKAKINYTNQMVKNGVDKKLANDAAKGIVKYHMAMGKKPGEKLGISYLEGAKENGDWNTIAKVMAKHNNEGWYNYGGIDKTEVALMDVDEFINMHKGVTVHPEDVKYYVNTFLEAKLAPLSLAESPEITLPIAHALKALGVKATPVIKGYKSTPKNIPAPQAPKKESIFDKNGLLIPPNYDKYPSWDFYIKDVAKEFVDDDALLSILNNEKTLKELEDVFVSADWNDPDFAHIDNIAELIYSKLPEGDLFSGVPPVHAQVMDVDPDLYSKLFHSGISEEEPYEGILDFLGKVADDASVSWDQKNEFLNKVVLNSNELGSIKELIMEAASSDANSKELFDVMNLAFENQLYKSNELSIWDDYHSLYASSKLKTSPPSSSPTPKTTDSWRIAEPRDLAGVKFNTPEDEELFKAMHYIRGTNNPLNESIKRLRKVAEEYGLDDVDNAAINLYTRGGDSYLNEIHRGNSKPFRGQEENFVKIDARLQAALDKLPNWDDELVYRRARKHDYNGDPIADKYRVGEIIQEEAYMSTTTKVISKDDIRFIVYSRTGKNITSLSEYPNEREVLFKAKTKFRVLAKIHHDSGSWDNVDIYLEEVTE
jgi:hypothetical protein